MLEEFKRNVLILAIGCALSEYNDKSDKRKDGYETKEMLFSIFKVCGIITSPKYFSIIIISLPFPIMCDFEVNHGKLPILYEFCR